MKGGGLHVDQDVVKQAVIGALEKAKVHSLESISIPAIGTGVYGLSIKDAVAGTLDAIEQHSKRVTSLKHIRLVMYSPEDHEAAARVFRSRLSKA